MKYRCSVAAYEHGPGADTVSRHTLRFNIKTSSLRAAYEKAIQKAREVYDSEFYRLVVEDISEGF